MELRQSHARISHSTHIKGHEHGGQIGSKENGEATCKTKGGIQQSIHPEDGVIEHNARSIGL